MVLHMQKIDLLRMKCWTKDAVVVTISGLQEAYGFTEIFHELVYYRHTLEVAAIAHISELSIGVLNQI